MGVAARLLQLPLITSTRNPAAQLLRRAGRPGARQPPEVAGAIKLEGQRLVLDALHAGPPPLPRPHVLLPPRSRSALTRAELCSCARPPHTVAFGAAATLLHPPLPVVGASIRMGRERQQHDNSLADGCHTGLVPRLVMFTDEALRRGGGGLAAALEPLELNPATRATDETVILLHPPLPLVGISIVMERERQQNDSPLATQAYRKRLVGDDPVEQIKAAKALQPAGESSAILLAPPPHPY